MKFTSTPVKPAKVEKFDFQAAFEGISASFDAVAESYDQLVAAEGMIAEINEVYDNCRMAYKSIEKFGVSVETMSLLNEGNSLDRALGLQDLALESIASLSEATKKALKHNYIAGLEAAEDGMLKKMVEAVKQFFVKLWQYIKELFVSNAKIAKVVQEIAKQDIKELDADKKVVAVKFDELDKMIAVVDGAYEKLVAGENATANKEAIELPDVKAARESATIKELGWDAAKLKASCGKFIKFVTKDDMKKVSDELKKTEKEAAEAASKNIVAEWKAKMQIAHRYGAWLRLYSKTVRQVGLTLIAVSKAEKKAEEKKEEKPAEEKK